MSEPESLVERLRFYVWLRRYPQDAPDHLYPGDEPGGAANLIEAQAAELSTLRSLEADIETFWKPQFDEQCLRAEAAEAARDEAARALELANRDHFQFRQAVKELYGQTGLAAAIKHHLLAKGGRS